VAGATSSPPSTFERYVSAWQAGDTAAATPLFADPAAASRLEAEWVAADDGVAGRIRALSDAEPGWGLDRDHPESNLRFVYHAGDPLPGAHGVSFDVQVVRTITVPTTFFGLVPASRSETRVVDTIGRADVIRRPLAGPLAFTGASVWLIDRVTLDLESP
jgi:hypothetical protein